MSAAFRKISRRAAGFVFDHAGNAACAAEMAELTSSRDADEALHICLCEEGELTAKVVWGGV
jgi:hypothetical protein